MPFTLQRRLANGAFLFYTPVTVNVVMVVLKGGITMAKEATEWAQLVFEGTPQ